MSCVRIIRLKGTRNTILRTGGQADAPVFKPRTLPIRQDVFTRCGSGHYRLQFRYVPRQITDSDECTFLYLLINCKDLQAAHWWTGPDRTGRLCSFPALSDILLLTVDIPVTSIQRRGTCVRTSEAWCEFHRRKGSWDVHCVVQNWLHVYRFSPTALSVKSHWIISYMRIRDQFSAKKDCRICPVWLSLDLRFILSIIDFPTEIWFRPHFLL